MVTEYRIIHYLNQFFGQIGGEDSAYQTPFYEKKPIGPGRFLDAEINNGTIIGTIICGDNYASEHIEELNQFVFNVLLKEKPDILIAGPAFNSGRYGLACANICKVVKEKLPVKCLTGLYEENPAVDLFKTQVDILRTKANAAGMKEAIQNIANVIASLTDSKEVYELDRDIFFPKGILKNRLDETIASLRAIGMTKSLLNGDESTTEIKFPDRVNQEKVLLRKDLSETEIALVTDGGLVPEGNPDRLETRGASKFFTYNIGEIDDFAKGQWTVAHEGYDNQYVLEDPDRLVPLDALRYFEKAGKIKKVHINLITTTGVATSLAVCQKIGKEIAAYLHNQKVDAAILSST